MPVSSYRLEVTDRRKLELLLLFLMKNVDSVQLKNGIKSSIFFVDVMSFSQLIIFISDESLTVDAKSQYLGKQVGRFRNTLKKLKNENI